MMLNNKKFEGVSYVSFDLFDTLIFRSFSSYERLFEFVEYEYNKKNNNKIFNFRHHRINAEKKARKKAKYKEVNLDEIYRELKFDKLTCQALKELEEKIEIETSVPNKEVINLLDVLRKDNKIILITTDIYLSRIVVESILEKNRIYYDYLFISGERKKTKHHGDLFLDIINFLNIDRAKIAHIGDNTLSDYKVPKSLGIKSVLYKRQTEEFPYLIKDKDIRSDHFNNIIRNAYYSPDEKYRGEYKIGFTVMGPVIVSFCQWIHQIKEVRGLNSLLFLAREGYAIKNIYEILFPNDKENVKYARINKNVLRLPLLTEENFSSLLKSTLKNNNKTSWRIILDSLNILDKDDITFPNNQNIDSNVSISDLDNPKYKDLIHCIITKLSDEVCRQSELLKEYLIKLGIIDNDVGLVNNSYSGNGQKLLTEFTKKNGLKVSFMGIQFAANAHCYNVLKENFVGWMNECGDSLMGYLFERGSLIFEHLLFEPNGTAVRFDIDGNGEVFVICEQPRTEQLDFEQIAAYQKGMTDFARIQKNNIDCYLGSKSMQYFINLIQKPTRDDAYMLGNLHDDDSDVDRFINDFNKKFTLDCFYRNDIYNSISWMQGFLCVKGKPDIFRKLFNLRLYITHLFHRMK